MKFIAIVSHPRSGSSYLISIFKQFADVLSMGELFHPKESAFKKHVKDVFDLQFDDFVTELSTGDSGPVEFAHRDPIALLQLIAAKREEQFMVFKIFPNHLSHDKLGELLSFVDCAVFFYRNPVHSFISSRFARKSDTWQGVDTSNVKLRFDPSEFNSWYANLVIFYEQCRGFVEQYNVESVNLYYEDLLDSAGASALVSRSLASTSCSLGGVVPLRAKYLARQDTRALAEDKVSNPAELKCTLLKLGIYRLNRLTESHRNVSSLHPTFLGTLASRIYWIWNQLRRSA